MRKGKLIRSLLELVIGICSAICFVLLIGYGCESFMKKLGSLLLAIGLIIVGITDLVEYLNYKK